MAKNSIRDFDNTSGNNTDIQSVDISEGCSPAGINNAIREMMADLADVNDGTVALVSPAMDSADINGGTIDGTVIGGTTPAAGTFTTLTASGDVNFDSNTLFVDASANAVGIGTTSPDRALHVYSSGTDARIKIEAAGTDGEATLELFNDASAFTLRIDDDDTFRIRDTDGSGERDRLVIDGSGNIGIGTSSPDTLLELRGADPILTIRDTNTSSASSNATLRLAETGASDTLDAYWDIKADGGQLQFIDNWNEGGGTGTRVVIDDSGSVGIGVAAPEGKLHIFDSSVRAPSADADELVIEKTGDAGLSILSTTTGRIYFGDAASDDQGSIRYVHTDNSMRFETDSSEAMRIDSGNLLVSTTSDFASGTVDGIIAQGTAKPAAAFSNTTDGQVVKFYQGGNLLGSIFSSGGQYLGIGNDDVGLLFLDAADDIRPWNTSTNAARDNAIDLGNSDARFKDLYMGGVLYMNVDSGAGSPDIKLQRTDTSVGSGNQIGSLQFWAGEDGSEEKVAAVRAVADDAYSSSSSATRLVFETTTSGSTSATEKARLDSAGNFICGEAINSAPAVQNSDFCTVLNSGGRIFSATNGDHHDFNRANFDGELFRFRRQGTKVGDISVTTSATSYNTSSDYRLKENVTDITDGIERVKQLNPSRFNFIADADTPVDGFLAHQVSDIVPEAVSGEKDAMRDEEYEVTPAVLDDDGNVVTEAVMGTRSVPDYQGIDQSKLVPLLTAALQEAITKIETLETQNADFATRIAALEAN